MAVRSGHMGCDTVRAPLGVLGALVLPGSHVVLEPWRTVAVELLVTFAVRGSPTVADMETSGPALRLMKRKQKRPRASRGVLPAGE
jgi:hypothetical protein